MAQQRLRILSLNIHKGFATGPKRLVLSRIRELLRESEADIVFLQEVVGANAKHEKRLDNWPDQSQLEFLADSVWTHHAYGKNAIYQHGHHGNAILSGLPFEHWENIDISVQRLSQRGFLYGRISDNTHLICVHLGLFERERRAQLSRLTDFVLSQIPKKEPLIIAGDFNDWRQTSHRKIVHQLGLKEAHEHLTGYCARTFPSFFPLLAMDRIYVRGFEIIETLNITGKHWREFSDHRALITQLSPQELG
ncbi:MAG: endonuclease/exonuclease/phosphatase family protein [Pseudohongiellaceae bacterium]|nr:endonuclease/exonuclease/phosphatase family protein [Pseudohongiellaceae bacterium]